MFSLCNQVHLIYISFMNQCVYYCFEVCVWFTLLLRFCFDEICVLIYQLVFCSIFLLLLWLFQEMMSDYSFDV